MLAKSILTAALPAAPTPTNSPANPAAVGSRPPLIQPVHPAGPLVGARMRQHPVYGRDQRSQIPLMIGTNFGDGYRWAGVTRERTERLSVDITEK